MVSLSDLTLTSWNWILGWIAIIGTALGLLSAVGTLIIGRELSRRQDAAENARVKKVTELEESQRPREITASQVVVMQRLLKDTPRGRITMRYPASEGEAGRFADKLHDALRKLGYDAEGPVAAVLSGYPDGLALRINRVDQESTFVSQLQAALRAIGNPAQAYLEDDVPVGVPELQVGPKSRAPN